MRTAQTHLCKHQASVNRTHRSISENGVLPPSISSRDERAVRRRHFREALREARAFFVRRLRMQIGMELARQLPVRHLCCLRIVGRDSEKADSSLLQQVAEAGADIRFRAGARRIGSAVARTLAPVEKVGRLQRLVGERSPGRSNRDPKADACIFHVLESRQARLLLAPKCEVDHVLRHAEVGLEHVAMQALRSERAQERAPENAFFDSLVAAKDFRKRSARTIDLDRSHATAGNMDPMRSSLRLFELQTA